MLNLSISRFFNQLYIKQLRALLWKCLIIRRVHYVSTFFELFSPLLLMCSVAIFYSNTTTNSNTNGTFSGPIKYANPRFTISFEPSKDFSDVQVFTVFYAPGNDFTRKLVRSLTSGKINNVAAIPFSTEAFLDEELQSAMANQLGNREIIAVFFNNMTSVNDPLSYRLKAPISPDMMHIMSRAYPDKFNLAPMVEPIADIFGVRYIQQYKRFSYVMAYINRAYLKEVCSENTKGIDCDQFTKPIRVNQMPYPRYPNSRSGELFNTYDIVAICIPLSYVLLVPLIVKRITDEKCSKARELLRLIGMSDLIFWTAHFLNHFAVILFHSIGFVIILFAVKSSIFLFSSWFMFVIGFTLFGAQAILFSMLLTTLLNRPVIATIVTTILWILATVLVFYNFMPSIHSDLDVPGTNPERIFTSFLPTGSIIWFVSIMGAFENRGVGLGFSNLNSPTKVYANLTAFHVLLIMFFSLYIYAFLIWYLDNVWPFQNGVPKSPIFLFKSSYWKPKVDESINLSHENDDIQKDTTKFEAEPKNLKTTIELRSVSKKFNQKAVVDNLCLNIYANQITVLLGHNGAGKTTTMNMITGMFGSTSGTIYVNGFNVFTQTKQARRSIGLCPQENIIFNELTVAQHLRLFAMLKDYPANKIEYEVSNILDLLKLMDKKNVLATKLSGGMKRKLSLGIALVGDTETLILDEPTSGMDPDARRVIWDLLMNIRRSRTILLTTHYMEEADILGDRIAIMNEGKLTCSGSPFFLKTVIGTGYRLRIAKQPQFNSTHFLSTLHKFIKFSTLKSEIETEVIYCLDNGQMEKKAVLSLLPGLFEHIEANKEKFGIDSVGLSYASLEDVFLQVGSDLSLDSNDANYSSDKIQFTDRKDFQSGKRLISIQFYALLLKRFHFARRYWPMIVFQLLIPGLIILLAMAMPKIGNLFRTSTKNVRIDMNVKQIYGANTETFYYGSRDYLGGFENINLNKNGARVSVINETLSDNSIDDWILDRVNGDIEMYVQKYLYGLGVDSNKSFTSWVNFEQYHSLPLSILTLYQVLLNQIQPNSSSIKVENAPVISTGEAQQLEVIALLLPWALSCLAFMPIAFPFLAASFGLLPIQEQSNKCKLIQLMTGVSPIIYWSANFVFDLANHVIAVSLLYLVIFIFDNDNIFFGGHHGSSLPGMLYLLLIAFGVGTIPLVYFLSYFFRKPSSGFVSLLIIFFLVGFIFNIIFSILDLMINYFHYEIMSFGYPFLLSIFRIVPIFSLLFAYQKLHKISSLSNACVKLNSTKLLDNLCSIFEYNPNPEAHHVYDIFRGCCKRACGDLCYLNEEPFKFGKSGAAIEVTYMFVCGLICLVMIVFYETYPQKLTTFFSRLSIFQIKFRKPDSTAEQSCSNSSLQLTQLDSDVELENTRIEDQLRNNQQTDLLVVSKLTKCFNQFTAVDELSFGVHYNECFGLLGVNGAGKTTTFSMLTGDLLPSGGNAYIQKGQFELIESIRHFQRNIGYCPQLDALLDKLTGEETLYLFGRLRGIPADSLARDIRNLIKMIGLEKHAGKRTDTYSGGNRRKLSIAIALIGNPPILFLDEPSAGVDPAARRKLWQTLGYLKRNFNSSIVLTSHSMEECEALCSRIGIMVNGRFRCLGSTQHLRSKYGQGYSVTISLRKQHESDQTYVNEVQAEMAKAIPSSVLKDYHQALMHYHVPDPNERWSNLFRQMSLLNDRFHFEDYFVSDTTLEQIFIMFARHQK